jgi:MFS family permease
MLTVDISRSARRIALTLFVAQSLGSAGFIAAATLSSILGAKLGGEAGWAGVPTAIYLLGAAGAAFLWGYLMDAIGRRSAIAAGLALGVIGAGLAFGAAASGSLGWFLGAMALMGVAYAALTLGRFAAAEVQPPEARGRAISNMVIGGAVGAVVGPLLVSPAGQLARLSGVDELAGAYAASLVLFAVAGAIVLVGLRPDPRDLGRQVARLFPETSPTAGGTRPVAQILRQPATMVAVVSMVLGQMVMVMVMAITALHMRQHQYGLGNISMVMSAHTFGMYGFSVISGRLADRWGRGPVILSGSGALLLACLAAPLSPQLLPLALALFLLGLGWNFCFIGGSTLLADQLSPAERARTQGFNDLLVGLAAVLGSLGSGLIFASMGFGVTALIGAFITLVPLAYTVRWLRGQHRGVVER